MFFLAVKGDQEELVSSEVKVHRSENGCTVELIGSCFSLGWTASQLPRTKHGAAQ